MPRIRCEADFYAVISWRPLAALAATLPLLVGVGGCNSADGVLAQQLLAQAQLAEKSVSSETFSAHLSVQAQGQQMDVRLTGGSYMKGPRAGDMVVDLQLSGPVAMPFSKVQIAKIGRSAWMSVDGKRMAMPAGASFGSSSSDASPLAGFDITRYVKAVKVQSGQVLQGKSVTKIVGVIDTSSLVSGFAKLGGLTSQVPGLDGKIGDTRVVIYVDDTTHLLTAALADLSMHAPDGDVNLHLDLVITGVNQPVALPSV